MPFTGRSPAVPQHGRDGGGRWRLSSELAVRLCFFTGLALELGGALVWTLLTRYGGYGQRGWLYHQTIAGHRTLFHWSLAIVLPIAYVGLARARMPARRWAVTGAAIAAGPHFLGYVARFALLWALEQEAHRPPDRPPDLGTLAAPFVSDVARSVLFTALLGTLAALMSALAAGPHRVATRPHSRDLVLRRLQVLARMHLLLAPLAAACAMVLPTSWRVGAFFFVAELAALHGARSPRLLAWLGSIWILCLYGNVIAHGGVVPIVDPFEEALKVVAWVMLVGVPIIAHIAYLLEVFFPGLLVYVVYVGVWVFALGCGGVACLPASGLPRRHAWARALSVAMLGACSFTTAVLALWRAAVPTPPIKGYLWSLSSAALERWGLETAAYGAGPLLLMGTAWRFLHRPDVQRLYGAETGGQI